MRNSLSEDCNLIGEVSNDIISSCDRESSSLTQEVRNQMWGFWNNKGLLFNVLNGPKWGMGCHPRCWQNYGYKDNSCDRTSLSPVWCPGGLMSDSSFIVIWGLMSDSSFIVICKDERRRCLVVLVLNWPWDQATDPSGMWWGSSSSI